MKCEDSEALLIDYALDLLDPTTTAEVREHLDEGCSVCARKLDEFVETWASLGVALAPVAPSPEVEAKLLGLVRGEIAPPVSKAERHTRQSDGSTRVLSYALAASLFGVAAAVLAWRFTPWERFVANPGEIVTPGDVWATSPTDESRTGFQTVALNPVAEQQGVQLSVVMMPQTREWHIIGRRLPKVAGEEKFQIWLETRSGDFQRLAVLPVESSGLGGVMVSVANIELRNVAGLWLTVESHTDSMRPSETVVFQATVK